MTSSQHPPSRTFTETARRAQIIAAAITTINEIGYHRASLAEIAQRAGVAKSAIVYYFSSRETLLLTVVDEVFTALGDAVAARVLALTAPVERLRAYAEAYFGHVDAHRAEVTAGIEIVVSHRIDDGTPLYLTGTDADTAVLRGILVDGMEAGVFHRMPLPAAVSIVEAIVDVWTTELQRDLDADISLLVRTSIEVMLRGFVV